MEHPLTTDDLHYHSVLRDLNQTHSHAADIFLRFEKQWALELTLFSIDDSHVVDK